MPKPTKYGRHRDFTSQQLVEIVDEEYKKLIETNPNPSYETLKFAVMLNRNWQRLRAWDAIGMWQLKTGIKLQTEETEKSKPYDWIKEITSNREEQDFIRRSPDEYQQLCKDLHKWMTSKKRFLYEETKIDFLMWLLREKNIRNYEFFTHFTEEQQNVLEEEYNHPVKN